MIETPYRCDVLDHGYVELVRHTPYPDAVVVEAARVSVKGLKTVMEDIELIRYLIRNKHLSPLEHVHYTFRLGLPLFVKQQLDTYRTAHRNAKSARYCAVDDEPYYIPYATRILAQSKTNKQGSGEPLSVPDTLNAQGLIMSAYAAARDSYRKLLDLGVARELARVVLPVGSYTEAYWTIDLRNLLHVIEERTSPHAQAEIREYALAFKGIVGATAPLVYQAVVGETERESEAGE